MSWLQKSVTLLGRAFGVVSFHDRDNFVTNRVTIAEYGDQRNPNESGVLGLSAAWACVNLLAGTIASLPLMVYRTDKNGHRSVARDHPIYGLLHDSPNGDQTALDFWEFICACLELRGNSYSEIVRGANGRISSLLAPVPPQLVKVSRRTNGSLEYRWSIDGVEKVLPQERMLHIRGFGGSPLGGLSTLSFGAGVFGGAMAIETASAATFRNGIRPSGVLEIPETLTFDQRKEAEHLLQEKYQGTMKAGLPMLLDRGLSFKPIMINPEDAQMLQSRAFSVEEICRIFGVPPFMVGHTEKTTSWGTGIEQQTIGFVQFTLRRRLKRIEQALEKQLLSPVDRLNGVKIEFNIEGLLRGDSKARGEFYKAALGDTQRPGWMLRNEVRRLENMAPVEGWDEPIEMYRQDVRIRDVPDADDEAGAPGEGVEG